MQSAIHASSASLPIMLWHETAIEHSQQIAADDAGRTSSCIIHSAYGNRDLYNKQLHRASSANEMKEPALLKLADLFHRHKKVLEQEVFIKLAEAPVRK